jgi:hypothetical protein
VSCQVSSLQKLTAAKGFGGFVVIESARNGPELTEFAVNEHDRVPSFVKHQQYSKRETKISPPSDMSLFLAGGKLMNLLWSECLLYIFV